MKRILSSVVLLSFFIAGCTRGGGSGSSGNTPGASLLQVSSTIPNAGDSGIPVGTAVSANFSQPIDVTSVRASSFTLFRGSNQVPGSVSATSNSATFHPTLPLSPDTIYRASLTQQIVDAQGLPLSEEHVWEFRTQDVIRPRVVEVSPPAGATIVPADSVVELRFSEPIDPNSVNNNTVYMNLTENPPGGASCPTVANVPGTIAVSGDRVYFDANSPFLPSQTNGLRRVYSIVVTTGVRDSQGNSVASTFCSNFTSIDSFGPVVNAVSPTVGETDVELFLPDVSSTFNERLNPASVDSSSFQLADDFGFSIPGTVSYDASSFRSILTMPASLQVPALAPNTLFTCSLDTTIRDYYENPMAAPYSWTFRTRSGWFVPLEVDAQLEEDAIEPQIATDPLTGKSFAIWLQDPPNINVSGIAVSSFGHYPDPSYVQVWAGGNQPCTSPRVAIMPNGTAIFVWSQDFATGIGSIVTRRILPDGTVTLFEYIDADGIASGTDATAPRIAVAPDNTAIVIFLQNNNIYATRLGPAGSWSVPQAIDDDGATSTRVAAAPQLVIDSAGVATAVFHQKLPGTGTIRNGVYAVSRIQGTGWVLPPTLIDNGAPATSSPTQDATQPQIATAPDGTVTVAFLQKTQVNGTGASVLANQKPPGGSWLPGSSLVAIDSDGTNSGLVCAAVALAVGDNGTAHVTYTQALSGNVTSVIYNQLPVGGVWSSPLAIDVDGPASGQLAAAPDIKVDANNRAVAVFTQRINGNTVGSIMATSLPLGGSWSPVVEIDPNTNNADKPNLAIDPVRNTWRVVWQQHTTGSVAATNSILVNEFR